MHNKTTDSRLKRIEARLNPPKPQKCYIHFEHEPIPEGYNPDSDKLITYVEVDGRVNPIDGKR